MSTYIGFKSPRCQRKTRNKIKKLTCTLKETEARKKKTKTTTMVLKFCSIVSVECNRQGQIIPDLNTGAIQTTFLSEFPLSKPSQCIFGLTGTH